MGQEPQCAVLVFRSKHEPPQLVCPEAQQIPPELICPEAQQMPPALICPAPQQMPPVQTPPVHCAALVQELPFESLPTQVLELQYLRLPQGVEAVDEQAPLPLQTGPMADPRSAEHDCSEAFEHVVLVLGKEHCVSELPLHDPAHSPEPAHAVRVPLGAPLATREQTPALLQA